MRLSLFVTWFFLACATAGAAESKILKVLPHLLDKEGRHALSPSLYERDAYQDHLRRNPENRGGIRYDVQWKSKLKKPLRMRVEIRGSSPDNKPATFTVEEEVRPRRFWSRWTAITLPPQDYEQFKEVLAWRITLWDGSQLVAERKSFLW